MTAERTSTLLIGAWLALLACSRVKPANDTPLEQGTNLLREKRYAEAAAKFEQVVAADPKNDLAWYQLASASRQAGNCQRALVAYLWYEGLVGESSDPYYGVGLCLQKVGDRAGALTSLRRYVGTARPGDAGDVEHARKVIAEIQASMTAGAATGDAAPLLTKQPLAPELRRLVEEAHAHVAVASLEAAGCDLALVMTGAKYERFVDLRHGTKMPTEVGGRARQVVWCQRRTPTPPDCAQLAPIFARVARRAQAIQVFSGYVDPPFAPRCAVTYTKNGKFVAGEGPEVPLR